MGTGMKGTRKRRTWARTGVGRGGGHECGRHATASWSYLLRMIKSFSFSSNIRLYVQDDLGCTLTLGAEKLSASALMRRRRPALWSGRDPLPKRTGAIIDHRASRACVTF